MLKVPVRLPVAVGVNATATVHDSEDPSVAPQVVTWLLKSPLVVMVNVIASAPVFEMRTSCAGAEVATVCDPNVSVAGNTAMADAGAAADTPTSVCATASADSVPATNSAGRNRRRQRTATTPVARARHHSANGGGAVTRNPLGASTGPFPVGGAIEDAVVDSVSTDRADEPPGVTVSGEKLHVTPGGNVPALHASAMAVE